MAQILSMDNGRSKVAVASLTGVKQFPSKVSEASTMLNPQNIAGDMEIEWNGEWYFVGNLAEREGRYPRSNYGKTKASEVTLIQLFAACWFCNIYGDINLSMVVPVDDFLPKERKAIRQLLKGEHHFNVRGVRVNKHTPDVEPWRIHVLNVLISQECAVGYWADPQPTPTQTLDFGAKTVNYCMHDKARTQINDLSGTLPDTGWEVIKEKEGLSEYPDDELNREEKQRIVNALSKRVCDHILKIGFKPRLKTQIIGGVADEVLEQVKKVFPEAYVIPSPRYANAVGAFKIGREVFKG